MINKYICIGVWEWNNKLKYVFSFELSICILMYIFVFCVDYVKFYGDILVFIGILIILLSYFIGDFICCWMKYYLFLMGIFLRYVGVI